MCSLIFLLLDPGLGSTRVENQINSETQSPFNLKRALIFAILCHKDDLQRPLLPIQGRPVLEIAQY
jgi:hypothetical protein